MKKSIIILLLSIPFIGFGQTQYDKSYYESGQLEYEGNFIDGKQDGLWKYYYESGQLETTRNFKDKYEGERIHKYQDFKHYYENGKIKEEGSGLVGGESNGLLIYQITWDKNGNKTIQVDNRDNLEYEKWWIQSRN